MTGGTVPEMGASGQERAAGKLRTLEAVSAGLYTLRGRNLRLSAWAIPGWIRAAKGASCGAD